MSNSKREQILEKLTQIFQDVFDDEDIALTPNSTAHDIDEWDSLNQIKIILASQIDQVLQNILPIFVKSPNRVLFNYQVSRIYSKR